MVATYPLVFSANHVFTDLADGRFLVDTGSPVTFSNSGRVVFGPVSKAGCPSLSSLDLSGLPDVVCDGLLGMDVISQVNTFWNGPDGTVTVGLAACPVSDSEMSFLPVRPAFGLPVLTATVNGVDTECIFDTGAQYGYVLDASQMDGATPTDDIADFNPIMGKLSSKSWTAGVRLGEADVRERFGVLAGANGAAVRAVGCSAIVGCSWMPMRRVWLSDVATGVFGVDVPAAK